MDTVTREKRSEIMSKIRSKNTVPELVMQTELLLRGHHPEMWISALPGKPDFVFYRNRLAVFVDGCFWHGCPRHGSEPKTNRSFWLEKFRNNRARDRRVTARLRRMGWCVLRFWECRVKEHVADCVVEIEERMALRRAGI